MRTVSWDPSGRVVVEDTSNSSENFYADRSFNGGTAGNTTYFGFDLTTGSTVAEGTYASITTGSKGYFGAGIDLSGQFGFFFNGSNVASSTTVANADTTYRLVVKITEAGNADAWSIFINPTSGVEGAQTVAKSGTGSYYVGNNASYPLGTLRIGKGLASAAANGTTYLDNIAIGTEFADVAIAVPEPATTAILLGFGALGLVLIRRRAR